MFTNKAERLEHAERLLEQWRKAYEFQVDDYEALNDATDATRAFFKMPPWHGEPYEPRETGNANVRQGSPINGRVGNRS